MTLQDAAANYATAHRAHLAATARAQAASALHTAGDPGQAVLEARMSAQQAGWAIRRNHGGRDLCAAHRIEAAA